MVATNIPGPGVRPRDRLVLLLVGCYLAFDSGFMQVRVPRLGIPIGEAALALWLASSNIRILLARFASVVFVLPFLLWWGWLGLRALWATSYAGIWALRDATSVVDSLFLLVGFSFASATARRVLLRWMPKFLLFVGVYALGYPLADHLRVLSPQVPTLAGGSVTVFFTYTLAPQMLLVAATYLLVFKKADVFKGHVWGIVPMILVVYAVAVFQGRVIYLAAIGVCIVSICVNRHQFARWTAALCVLFGVLALLPLTGLEIKGRLGEPVSVRFLTQHMLTIVNPEGEGFSPAVRGAAGGVTQRTDWWTNIYDQVTQTPQNMAFGLGYGMPLTDFTVGEGVAVREPHNSYISVVARAGLAGAVLWLWIHFLLLRVWRQTYVACKRCGWDQERKLIIVLLMFFITAWLTAVGEDAFEKPFFSIPYWFFWGVILRLFYEVRVACIRQTTTPEVPHLQKN